MKPEDLVKGTRLIKKGVRPEHQRRYTVELTAKEHWGHLMLYLRNESTQQLKHVKVQNVLENFELEDARESDDQYVQKLKDQLERACLDRDALKAELAERNATSDAEIIQRLGDQVASAQSRLDKAILDRDAEHRLRLEAEASLLRLQREFDSFKLSAEYRMIA